MSRKRKFCIDLTGRSEEEKERIMQKVEEVIEQADNEETIASDETEESEDV